MTLPGDPNLPPGVSTRDTDGPQGSGATCPKCSSDNVSELNDPDLLCCDCDHDWVRGKEDESDEPDSIDLNDWTYKHARAVYDATQYLSDGHAQRKIRLMAWEDAPDSLENLI